MANSIQAIGNRVIILNDLDLIALFSLLNILADATPGKCISLQPFIKRWQKNCANYGPGTLDLELDKIVNNQAAKLDLEQLLAGVEHELDTFGGTIPASSLNRNMVPGVKLHDYPAMNIRTMIRKIRAFVDADTIM